MTDTERHADVVCPCLSRRRSCICALPQRAGSHISVHTQHFQFTAVGDRAEQTAAVGDAWVGLFAPAACGSAGALRMATEAQAAAGTYWSLWKGTRKCTRTACTSMYISDACPVSKASMHRALLRRLVVMYACANLGSFVASLVSLFSISSAPEYLSIIYESSFVSSSSSSVSSLDETYNQGTDFRMLVLFCDHALRTPRDLRAQHVPLLRYFKRKVRHWLYSTMSVAQPGTARGDRFVPELHRRHVFHGIRRQGLPVVSGECDGTSPSHFAQLGCVGGFADFEAACDGLGARLTHSLTEGGHFATRQRCLDFMCTAKPFLLWHFSDTQAEHKVSPAECATRGPRRRGRILWQ